MYGRRPAIWFASVLFTVGAVIQASSYTIAQMSVGRVAVGLGVGSASMVSLSSNTPYLMSIKTSKENLLLIRLLHALDRSSIHRRDIPS